MAFTKKKRKEIETLIFLVFDKLDKTNLNTKKYKDFFKGLNDKRFTSWATKFFKDPEENFFLEVLPYKNEPHLKDIKKAANVLKIPLEEVVTFPHLGGVQTPQKVPVGWVFVKRKFLRFTLAIVYRNFSNCWKPLMSKIKGNQQPRLLIQE